MKYGIFHIMEYIVQRNQRKLELRECGAVFKNQSPNQHLYQGPDLTNNLSGMMCRFRKVPVAFTCDIEAMFYQIEVDPVYKTFWWKAGDTDSEVVERKMTVHLFGATSSPSVANFVLRTATNESKETYGPITADFIRDEL